VKADWFSDPSRVHREALGIRWLSQLAPPGTITPLVFEDFENHLIAMQAVPRPHENWKTMLLSGRIDLDHFRQFGMLLGTIHKRAADRAAELAREFDDRSFFESLRVEPYYLYTAQQVPEAAGFLRALVEETRARRLTLVHGDYSPKNILVHDGQLMLVDHEVIHWGDPAFDLGFALAHFFAKAGHLRACGNAMRQGVGAFKAAYVLGALGAPWVTGRADDDPHVIRHTMACILARVAGRSQLEYLSDNEKQFCRRLMVRYIKEPPDTLTDLISSSGIMEFCCK
jgi:5-methylthioribose kinase